MKNWPEFIFFMMWRINYLLPTLPTLPSLSPITNHQSGVGPPFSVPLRFSPLYICMYSTTSFLHERITQTMWYDLQPQIRMKSSIDLAGYRRAFLTETKRSVVQMHIASGHLRGRAQGGWGDTSPWGVNMNPFHPKCKSSEWLIQFFVWMAELACREPQYLQILDLPHKTVF